MFLTIIVPCFNSFAKMDETLASAAEVLALEEDVELVLVDDVSTDGTYEALVQWSAERDRCSVLRLEENSGTAAGPRNRGIEAARGRYVFFLDADDPILLHGFRQAIKVLRREEPDALRTPLMVRWGDGRESLADEIPQFGAHQANVEKIRLLVRHQSLTCSFFMRLELLKANNISFDIRRRIGEDILFTSQVLVAAVDIAYASGPVRVYQRGSRGGDSVTQSISSKQFLDFFQSWEAVESVLAPAGVSFMMEHGHAALQYALRQYVWFRTETMAEPEFRVMSDFVTRHWAVISSYPLPPRFRELVLAAHSRDLSGFNRRSRMRLLIAGHDLKFMAELIPHLERDYEIREDLWSGHTQHDEVTSAESLAWADVVWVEWLLGAAVWYSEKVQSWQRLVVRAHRSEVTVNYGDAVRFDNVAALITVSPHLMRDFVDRFDIERSRVWVVPNLLNAGAYRIGEDPERCFRLAMVGAVPKLKGFRRAIEILALLRGHDERYTLTIYGKSPEQLDWIVNDPEQAAYYEDCAARAAELGVEEAIEWLGWRDLKDCLADDGIVLSLSDVESFHLAPAEAFCAGGVGLLRPWRGARDIYPSRFVVETQSQMVQRVLDLRNETLLSEESDIGRRYVRVNYGQERVVGEVQTLIRAIRS